MHPKREIYLRNFIFGVEDSLVSTVGLLSGIAIGGAPREVIILTGVVLVLVEAFSMGVGSFLAEYTAEEMVLQREIPRRTSVIGGIIMFVSYVAAGCIPLLPYVVLSVTSSALNVSIIASLLALFFLGMLGGRIGGAGIIHRGFRMLILGGLAIAVGALAARFAAFVSIM